jgi:PAS domain S-box-containing protein
MHGTFQDITERVQAEEALRESEEKYRDLVEKVSDVIYVLDMEGVLTYVSSAIESFLGFSPSEVVGQPIFKFLHPEDVQLARNTIQKLKSGQSPGPNEYRLVTKSGEIRWMRTSSQPVVEGEQTTGVRGVLTDITDRKQMEEALRTSQQLLQSALDALSANIAILDEAGKIMVVNASWRAFADENDLAWADYGVGRNYLAVADSASGDSAEGAQEAAGGIGELLSGQRDRFLVEYPCHRPGEERWFIMRATRFESSEGVRVAVSHENITERKRAERQIEQAAAVAERERLARDLHDAVTQALFSASLVADTLPRIWERYPEEGRRGLEELRRLTHGALAEMRTLLLELRPDALSEQDLGVLLRQLTDGMMARMRIPVATTVVGDCSLPAEVQIALYRIAQEALNNIAKHARASRAAVSLDCEPDRVTLRISDDGQGFDPEAAQPHQLGMKIMHERAQAIGASIRAKSQPGQGTELVVTWTGDGKTKDGHLRLSPTRGTVQAGRIAKDEGRGERGGCP